MTDHHTSELPELPGREKHEGVLPRELLLKMHDLMLTGRVLEERLIRMQRQGQGYFWIGGPGEEAFNTALGLLAKKGQGLDYDYLHLHYRSSATLLAMGADPVDALRQMANVATDPYSGGRNFVGHYTKREWNVVPVSSPIEVQYSIAIGTAIAQARGAHEGITIVQGGDAGSAEGDFASALVWAARPANPLPMLIIVTNNEYGISTEYDGQHGEKHVSDRGKPFGMRTLEIDGNDPEEAYLGLKDAMEYVRTERKPMVLEAKVSRLYGHSSSSGSNFVTTETDCVAEFEKRLDRLGVLSLDDAKEMRDRLNKEMAEAVKAIRKEPKPTAESIWDFIFADRNHVAGEV